MAGMARVDNGNAVGAGVGADNAAQLEHNDRRMAECLFAGLDKLVALGGAGRVSHHVGGVLHGIDAALHPFDHGGGHSGVAAHLGFDLGDARVQADDGADAQQVTHHGSGGADAAGLLHLLQAVCGQADLHAVQALLHLLHAGGKLAAVTHLAGALAQIPAVGHRVGVAVDELDVQLMAGALLGQHLRTFDGVVVGTGSRAVDAQMHQVGIALVHIALVNLAPLQLSDGGGGGHALGVAHHLVKLVIGEILALHVFHAVQVDGEAHDLDAVLVRKLLRNVGTGIRQKTDLAHFTSSLHS